MLAPAPARRQARSLRFLPDPWSSDHPDWLYLDSRLPHDHKARLIHRLLDLVDFQPLLPQFYAGFGSPSYHPRVYLAVLLYELEHKVLSPACWVRDCIDSLPLRWLPRGACPSRSCLYQCRDRFCPQLLQQLNQQLLLLAHQEQLCPAQAGSLDGTFVAAKASRHHLLNLRRLDKRLVALTEVLDAQLQGKPATAPAWMATTHEGRLQQYHRCQQARVHLLEKIERHRKRQSSRAKKKRQPDDRVVISVSEPQAAIGRDKAKVVRPLYDVQILRDLDSDLVLGYGVFATNTDAGLLPSMLQRTKELHGTLPKELLADGIYSSVRDLRACQQEQVVLYAPVEDKPQAGKGRGMSLPVLEQPGCSAGQPAAGPGRGYYPKQRFAWDAPTSSYPCPAGQRLVQVGKGKERRGEDSWVEVESYGTKACQECQQRQECTRRKQGRRIKRLVEEPLVEELRQRMRTEQGKEKYKRRKETIERVFADWKEHRGLRQFASYGRERAETTVALLVLLHNGKALLQARQAAQQAA